jgi:PAS domain S-box-containing protein
MLEPGVVFDVSPNSYMILDRDLRYVAANRAYCATVKRRREDLIGRRLIDLFPHDSANPASSSAGGLVASFRRVFETAEADFLPVIHYRIAVDGRDEDRYWSASQTPLFDGAGRVEHVLQHTVDITELHLNRLAGAEAGVLERVEVIQRRYRWLEDAFLQAPVAVMILRGADFVVEAINKHACDIVGCARDELLHKPLFEVFPETAGQGIEQPLADVLRTGVPFTGTEVPFELERNGRRETVYVTFVDQPMVDERGMVDSVIVVAADVTKEVLARRKVETAQAELQAMFDSFPEAIIAGTETSVTHINQHALDMLGYRSANEILHHPIAKVARDAAPRSPATRELIPITEVPCARAFRGMSTRLEMLITKVHTLEERYVFASGAPVIVNGVPTAAVCALIDITEQKRNENEVLKLARVLDATRDFVGICDMTLMPTFVNPAGLELVGLPDLDAARARPVLEYYAESERDRVRDEVVPAAMRDNYWEGEITFKHARTGEHIPVRHAVFPMRDSSGTIIALATITHDLRAQKSAETERAQLLDAERGAREQAEQANQLKDQFLATVSHELRTPLTSILGWMQMLRAGLVKEDRIARAYETVERNALIQTQLIEDLLDVSRILSGKLSLDLEAVDIAQVVAAAVETVRLAADAKGIALATTIESTAPMIGDPRRLQQVVWNLLANAVKFTPRGGRVSLRVTRRDERVEIAVTDTGAGIAKDFLPHVFERFRQADAGTTRHPGGLGLGLSIVRHVVSAHHGEVHAYSDGPGTGARFVVSLPISAAAAKLRVNARGEAIEPPAALVGRHVLVVDDDDDTREYVGALLREAGAHVDVANGASEAIDAFDREPPDAVVSDLAMPGIDGFELIRFLRARPDAEGGRTPAIALTAFARNEDRMRAMHAGFQNHVAKPVDPAELFAVLVAVLR